MELNSIKLDDFADALQQLIPAEISTIELATKGSRPLFIIFREGDVKAVIDGANSPMLKAQIDHFLPPVPEGFDE